MVYSSLYRFELNDLLKIKDFYAVEMIVLINELSSLNDDIVFLGDGVSRF